MKPKPKGLRKLKAPLLQSLSNKSILKGPFSKLQLIVFVVTFGVIGGYILLVSHAAGSTTGDSLGICSPSPCTAGSMPASFPAVNQISLGTVNNDWANENYIYHYYVPHGLACTGAADCSAADPNHKPAAVFMSSGSGGYPNNASGITALNDSGWAHVADANHLVIIVLDWPTNCVSQVINTSGVITTPGTEITCGGWQRPKTTCDMYNGTAPNYVRWNYNIDGAGAGGTVVPSGHIICDASGNNAADRSSSVPYVVALVNNAVSRFGLDSSRLYFTGASSGGALTRELFCDSRSSNLFRGYAIVSNGTNSVPNGTTGSCPNSANRNVFVQYVSGTNASQDPYNTFMGKTCVVGATGLGSNPCTHEQMGFTASRNWTASYFGCGSPTVTGTSGSLTTNVIYDYNCIYGSSPQVEFISVGNGGHTWTCLDTVPQLPCAGKTINPTNGFNTAQSNWAFFAGTTTGSGTPAPTVSLSAAPPAITSGSSSTLTWSSTNATSCTASGAWSGSKATAGSQSVSPTTTSTYTLACTGSGGSANRSAAVTVTNPPPADTTPPTVSITAPANGTTVQGSSVNISVTAADNTGGSGLASISLTLDSNGILGPGSTTSPYTYTWNTTTLANGTHTLKAIATDKVGNAGTSSTITVTVNNTTSPGPDTTPPTTPPGLAVSGSPTSSSISLAWNASTDPTVSGKLTSGVASYDVFRNSVYITTVPGLSYADLNLSPATTYSYTIRATDNAGNHSAQSSAKTITTAATPPNPPSPPPVTPIIKKGDVNGDGLVTLTDLSILLTHYNTNYSPADFDSNSLVSLPDLSILLSNYGG
jgi:poly(3-hydroxybutyrate) depolymerase/chitodextrinase